MSLYLRFLCVKLRLIHSEIYVVQMTLNLRLADVVPYAVRGSNVAKPVVLRYVRVYQLVDEHVLATEEERLHVAVRVVDGVHGATDGARAGCGDRKQIAEAMLCGAHVAADAIGGVSPYLAGRKQRNLYR